MGKLESWQPPSTSPISSSGAAAHGALCWRRSMPPLRNACTCASSPAGRATPCPWWRRSLRGSSPTRWCSSAGRARRERSRRTCEARSPGSCVASPRAPGLRPRHARSGPRIGAWKSRRIGVRVRCARPPRGALPRVGVRRCCGSSSMSSTWRGPAVARRGRRGAALHAEHDRANAYYAAVAEHLALTHRLQVPAWTLEAGRFLRKPWFPAGLESLKATLLVESPPAFRRRMIFVDADPLYRPRRASPPRSGAASG